MTMFEAKIDLQTDEHGMDVFSGYDKLKCNLL